MLTLQWLQSCNCFLVPTPGAEACSRERGGQTQAGSSSASQQELAKVTNQSSYSDPEVPCLAWDNLLCNCKIGTALKIHILTYSVFIPLCRDT